MALVLRGALLGAAYGLAITTFEFAFELLRFQFRPTPPDAALMLQAAALEIAVLTVLGAVLSPLLRLGRGWLWHTLVLAVLWQGVQMASAIASPPVRTAYTPLIGWALFALGYRLAGKRAWVPVAVSGFFIAAGALIPELAMRPAPPPPLPPAAAGAPDVVLVVLDTVRAQSVSAYGYERNTTPRFDALAKESALFLDATAPATWSPPSHGSLFTGLFASVHGAHNEHPHLDEGPPTLAELLTAAGYETRAFTANPWISPSVGLSRGFRESDEAWRGGTSASFHFLFRLIELAGFTPDDKGGSIAVENFERWLSERPADGPPAFTFLNFLEAHFPYHHIPESFLRKFTSADEREMRRVSYESMSAMFSGGLAPDEDIQKLSIDMYDAGILYADSLLGRVVDALAASGRLDQTVLVVLSDHGELVGDHGAYGHGPSLHEVAIRVPLLIRYPPVIASGSRVAQPVSTVGVAATVLELASVEPPARLHVGSLLPALQGRPAGMPVLSERMGGDLGLGGEPNPHPLMQRDLRYRSYRVGHQKIVERSDGKTFVYDLKADPTESRDLSEARPELAARLRFELDTWQQALGLPALDADLGQGEVPDLDPAARERLKGLGYVE